MAEVHFDGPPVLAGSAETKLQQLYSHLGILSNKLNEALMTISIEQLPAEIQRTYSVNTGNNNGENTERKKNNEDEFTRLKSLIIKNAELVKIEMEEIRTTLRGQFEAFSDQFGAYQGEVENQLIVNGRGIEQNYELVETLQIKQEENESMIRKINGNIFSGIIDTNTGDVGIAIGYNVTNDDGTLNMGNRMVTLTADALTFYVNGNRAAWFSNSVFNIENGEVTKSMRMGSYIWQVFTGGAMGLMKA